MSILPKTDARRRRLFFVLLLAMGVGTAFILILLAFKDSISLFYTPSEVVQGKAPVKKRFSVGGFVVKNSLKKEADGLTYRYTIKDKGDATIQVVFKGILPAMFKEGEYSVSKGKLEGSGVFRADEVLAKHDETYIAPGEKAKLDQTAKMKSVEPPKSNQTKSGDLK